MTETLAYLVGLPVLALMFTAGLVITGLAIDYLSRRARNHWSYE